MYYIPNSLNNNGGNADLTDLKNQITQLQSTLQNNNNGVLDNELYNFIVDKAFSDIGNNGFNSSENMQRTLIEYIRLGYLPGFRVKYVLNNEENIILPVKHGTYGFYRPYIILIFNIPKQATDISLNMGFRDYTTIVKPQEGVEIQAPSLENDFLLHYVNINANYFYLTYFDKTGTKAVSDLDTWENLNVFPAMREYMIKAFQRDKTQDLEASYSVDVPVRLFFKMVD